MLPPTVCIRQQMPANLLGSFPDLCDQRSRRCPTGPLEQRSLACHHFVAGCLEDLEQASRAHAATDAHGGNHVLGPTALAFQQQVPH